MFTTGLFYDKIYLYLCLRIADIRSALRSKEAFMNQLELLWEYQLADVEADKMENAMKRSPARQKLLKYRDYLVEQQNTIKRIEGEILAMSDRIDALHDAINRTEEQLSALQAKVAGEQFESSERVRAVIDDAQRFLNNLIGFEQELKHIRKDATDRDRLQQDVKLHAAKAKNEYNAIKTEYDTEYKDNSVLLDNLRSKAKEKTIGIEPEYLDRYRTIKLHSVPPLARLQNDQCGGCNMSLPSVVLRNVKAGKTIECETCGRLIII
jgi:uncharacterized protein